MYHPYMDSVSDINPVPLLVLEGGQTDTFTDYDSSNCVNHLNKLHYYALYRLHKQSGLRETDDKTGFLYDQGGKS